MEYYHRLYYTSILGCSVAELEEFYGQKPITADRELVEQQADLILEGADEKNIAFLVGYPLAATTHTHLVLRAKQKNIEVKMVSSDAIKMAVARCGLQLYNFDIKVKEPTLESLTKKKREYIPPLFMSVKEASAHLLEIIESRKDNEAGISKESLCVGFARLGNDDEKIVVCSLEKMASVDLGAPLHCMVIAAPTLHPMELYVEKFRI